MNKKLIIGIVILIGLLTAAGVAYNYFSGFKKALISFEKEGITSAEVYQYSPYHAHEGDEETKIATLSKSDTLSLKPGKYYVIPKGDTVDDTEIPFTIDDKDITVSLRPGYSEAYLESVLAKELPTIRSVIESTYSAVSDFTIETGKLYEDGTWYGTLLVQKVEPKDVGDTYRVVLHKTNGTWKIAAAPRLVLTIPEHKDIPAAILRDLNKQATSS